MRWTRSLGFWRVQLSAPASVVAVPRKRPRRRRVLAVPRKKPRRRRNARRHPRNASKANRTMAKRTRPQKKVIDPELKQALEQAPADSTVQATFTLTTPAGEPYRDKASTQAAVKDLIDKPSTAAAAQHTR